MTFLSRNDAYATPRKHDTFGVIETPHFPNDSKYFKMGLSKLFQSVKINFWLNSFAGRVNTSLQTQCIYSGKWQTANSKGKLNEKSNWINFWK